MMVIILSATLALMMNLTFLVHARPAQIRNIARYKGSSGTSNVALVPRSGRKRKATTGLSRGSTGSESGRNSTPSNPSSRKSELSQGRSGNQMGQNGGSRSQTQSQKPQSAPRSESPSRSIGPVNRQSGSVESQHSLGPPGSGRPPSPSRSSSASEARSSDLRSERSWNGHGFTTSGSPSSWGSRHESVTEPDARVHFEANGPAIVRVRTKQSGRRAYADIPEGGSWRSSIADPRKVQVAVHVRGDKGHAAIDGLGLNTRVTVDARQNPRGGTINKLRTAHLQEVMADVLPHEKANLRYFADKVDNPDRDRIQATIAGKGTIKINSFNAQESGHSSDEVSAHSQRESSSDPSGSNPAGSASSRSRYLKRRSLTPLRLFSRTSKQRPASSSPPPKRQAVLDIGNSHGQPIQLPKPGTWTTDPATGWVGDRKSRRQDPRQSSSVEKPPVQVKASLEGPAALRVTTSDQTALREVHRVAQGEKKEFEMTDPKRLKVKVDLGSEANARLQSSGGKSYMAIETKSADDFAKLTATGPGARRKEAMPTAVEQHVSAGGDVLQTNPPRGGTQMFNKRLKWSIKTASRPDQAEMVETTGNVRNREGERTSEIRTVVSNSPSHSPPSSPVRSFTNYSRTIQTFGKYGRL